MNRHLATVTLAGLLLVGCASVGPDYTRPATAGPATFSEAPPGTHPGEIERTWWASFGDPVLDDLVTRARSSNLDLAVAAARVRQARAVLLEAGWSLAPTGAAQAGYERRRLTEAETGFGDVNIELYRIGADAAWEIDLFGRNRRGIEAAAADVESAEAMLAGAQVSVIAEIARVYFDLRGAENEVRALNALRANQAEGLEIVRQIRDVGAASELDLIQAESQLRAVEALAPEATRRVKAAHHALAILLGVRPDQMNMAPEPYTAVVPTNIAISDPAALLRRRPDVAAAERRLAASTARIGVATAELYPSVQVSGSLGLVAGSLDALGTGGAMSGFIAPVIRWAFLDMGRVRARIAGREAQAQEALAVYERTVLVALQETEDAFAGYTAATEALQVRLERAALDRRAAELARIRFAEGEGVFLQVLDAERVRLDSQIAVVQAATAHRLAVVAIHKALGGGWGFKDSVNTVETTETQIEL
jgi:multidrug efflux system outer membrane protein